VAPALEFRTGVELLCPSSGRHPVRPCIAAWRRLAPQCATGGWVCTLKVALLRGFTYEKPPWLLRILLIGPTSAHGTIKHSGPWRTHAMSPLQIGLFLSSALDIVVIYATVIIWLRGMHKQTAVVITSCEIDELGSLSKRPYQRSTPGVLAPPLVRILQAWRRGCPCNSSAFPTCQPLQLLFQ